MISVDAALQILLEHARPLAPAERELDDALGCVLAEALVAREPLPPFDNSAMDGYALRAADLRGASADRPICLPLHGEVAAGSRTLEPVPAGAAVRIMTGAPVPPGVDAVIRVEDTEPEGNGVRFQGAPEPGACIRRAGEDVTPGQVVVPAGLALTPARIQMAAAMGAARVRILPRPRVAILTTGDELVAIDQTPGPFQIRNSNLHGLVAQVRAAGAEPLVMPVAADTREATEALIKAALAAADALVSSGGVSLGVYDHVGEVLGALGTVHFTAIAQQPGKPFTFAMVDGKPCFGLPGNPVSTHLGFELYVRPALRRMQGHEALFRPRGRARMASAARSPEGKRSFLRASLHRGEDGLEARLTGPQGSGIIHSLVMAEALVVVPEPVTRVEAGQEVEILRLDLPEEVPWPN